MNPLIERTGWTLLHSLWEGGLIWAGLQMVLLALRRYSAQSRYLAGCAALALAVLLPLATFLYLGAGSEDSPGPTGSTVAQMRWLTCYPWPAFLGRRQGGRGPCKPK